MIAADQNSHFGVLQSATKTQNASSLMIPSQPATLVLIDKSEGAALTQRRLDLSQPVKLCRQTSIIPSESNAVFASRVLSRNHAQFMLVEGAPHIMDLGSSNGSWLNGVRLSEENQTSKPFSLKNGDSLVFGVDIPESENKQGAYSLKRVELTVQIDTQEPDDILRFVNEEIAKTAHVSTELATLKQDLSHMEALLQNSFMPSTLKQSKLLEEARTESKFWKDKYGAIVPLIASQEDLEKKLASLMEENKELKGHMEAMKATLESDSTNRYEEQFSAMEKLAEELELLRHAYARLEQEKQTAQHDVEEMVKDRDDLLDQLSAIAKEKQDTAKQLKEVDEALAVEKRVHAEKLLDMQKQLDVFETQTLQGDAGREALIQAHASEIQGYDSILKCLRVKLEDQKQQFDQEKQSLHLDLTTLNSRLEDMMVAKEQLEERVYLLQNADEQLQLLSTENTGRLMEIEALKERIHMVEAEREAFQQMLDRSKEVEMAQNEEFQELKRQKMVVEAQVEHYHALIKECEGTIKKQEERIESLENDQVMQKEEHALSLEMINRLEDTVKNRDDSLCLLKQNLEKADHERQELRMQLSGNQEIMDELQKKIDEFKSQKEFMNAAHSESSEKVEQLNASLKSAEESKVVAEDKLKALERHFMAMSEKNSILDEELKQAKYDVMQAEIRESKLNEKLVAAEHKMAEMSLEGHAAQLEAKNALARVAELEEHVNAILNQLQSSKSAAPEHPKSSMMDAVVYVFGAVASAYLVHVAYDRFASS